MHHNVYNSVLSNHVLHSNATVSKCTLGMVQDVVTRGGKFFFLYKRPGNRVIVNDGGHMMVSPSSIEASVQQSIAGGLKPSPFCLPPFLSPCPPFDPNCKPCSSNSRLDGSMQ